MEVSTHQPAAPQGRGSHTPRELGRPGARAAVRAFPQPRSRSGAPGRGQRQCHGLGPLQLTAGRQQSSPLDAMGQRAGAAMASSSSPVRALARQDPPRLARPGRGCSGAAARAGRNIFEDLSQTWQALQAQQAQQAEQEAAPRAGALRCTDIIYQPAGASKPLLRGISLELAANELGIVFGRSGAGKTTLLQVLAGLAKASAGTVDITGATRSAAMVFQFPERHFLGDTLEEELAFAWPRTPAAWALLNSRCQVALPAVGLGGVGLKTPLRHLSDGFKRRVALAAALIRRPSVLLLDEPLAGLDWRSRADVASVLGVVKQECTILVVSHDLRELGGLVDRAWRMRPGGALTPSAWPPDLSEGGDL